MKSNRPTCSKARRLFVIDIENIKGKAVLTEEDAIVARAEIENKYAIGNYDLVLIGTSHKNNFLSAKFAWPSVQHCFKPGHNGADIALINAAEEHLSKPGAFQEVVLLSGDGIFTKLMCKVRQMGIKGRVISLADQINKDLANTSANLTLLAPASQAI